MVIMSTLNILIQSSDFYSPFAGVTLESLFYNNKDIPQIQVFLISDGIKQSNLKKIDELSAKYNRKITIIDGKEIGEKLASLGVKKYRGESYTNYYKVFADKFIPENVDKLLYLDSDLIIDGSLKPLTDFDMAGNVVAMAIEPVSKTHKSNIGVTGRYYFNTGVILFDMARWKSEKWSDKIMDHITNVHATYPLHEQDIMSVIMDGKIAILDLKYNFNTDFIRIKNFDLLKKIFDYDGYYSEKEYTDALDSSVVYHCMQYLTARPWVKGNKCPVSDKWDRYVEQSPWKGFQKIKDNRGFALKCQAFLFAVLPKNMFAFINRHITKHLQNKRASQNNIGK